MNETTVIDCSICCTTFNKTNHKVVTCPHCKNCACMTCIKTFLVTTEKAPCCMHCSIQWSYQIIIDTMPPAWVKSEYRSGRMKTLLTIEKSKIQTTQRYLTTYRRLLILQDIVKELHKNAVQCRAERDDMQTRLKTLRQKVITDQHKVSDDLYLIHVLQEKIAECNNTIDAVLPQQISNYRVTIRELEAYIRGERIDIDECETKNDNLFNYPCAGEVCRGFLNKGFNCITCGKQTCKECFEIKLEGHECLADTVESVKLLKTDSKPCSKCGTFIFKIMGCNQMWCTQCKTGFDWDSGAIITRDFHNPHYMEWQQNNTNVVNTEAVQEIQCGESYAEIDILRILPSLNTRIKNANERQYIVNVIQQVKHVYNVSIHECTPIWMRNATIQDVNLYLRLEYLNGTLAEKDFTSKLYQREQQGMMTVDYQQLWETLIMVSNQLLGIILEPQQSTGNALSFKDFCMQWQSIKEYIKSQHDLLNARYKKSYKFID